VRSKPRPTFVYVDMRLPFVATCRLYGQPCTNWARNVNEYNTSRSDWAAMVGYVGARAVLADTVVLPDSGFGIREECRLHV
jgi:hypothetical protein